MNLEENSKSYEVMLKEVEHLVAQMNRNEISLDDLVGKVEQGFQLIKLMHARLDRAKLQVEELKQTYDQQNAALGPKDNQPE